MLEGLADSGKLTKRQSYHWAAVSGCWRVWGLKMSVPRPPGRSELSSTLRDIDASDLENSLYSLIYVNVSSVLWSSQAPMSQPNFF